MEETVAESRSGGMDALVPCARWQGGEESIRRVGGVVHNVGGIADEAFMVSMVSKDTLTMFSAVFTICCGVLRCSPHTRQ